MEVKITTCRPTTVTLGELSCGNVFKERSTNSIGIKLRGPDCDFCWYPNLPYPTVYPIGSNNFNMLVDDLGKMVVTIKD